MERTTDAPAAQPEPAEVASPPAALDTALAAARAEPETMARWDELERLAAVHQRPEEVAALYRDVLAETHAADLLETLGERAIRFHEEWFGEDAPQLATVLSRIFEVSETSAEWAFSRLTVLHTGAGRWDELFALYDQLLAKTPGAARKADLLHEAVQASRDFAGKPERAVGYLEQLLALRPDDALAAASLERLYERLEEWEKLVGFWKTRLDTMSAVEAQKTRLRIANLWFEPIGKPANALDELAEVIDSLPDPTPATNLLERIMAADAVPTDVRKRASTMLTSKFLAEDRGTDLVRSLDVVLALSEPSQAMMLYREAGDRSLRHQQFDEAMDYYAKVFQMTPADGQVRDQLRTLAERTGSYAKYATALSDAADASADASVRIDVRLEAAQLQQAVLGHADAAVDQYRRVLQDAQDNAPVAARVLRSLADVHAQRGEPEERLAALEMLASYETGALERRDVWGQIARLATEMGHVDRALRAWEQRLEVDSADAEALDGCVDLLTKQSRWQELVVALQRRSKALSALRRREDAVMIASIQADQLDAPAKAIETWQALAREYGEDDEVSAALARLYEVSGRWAELISLLEREGEREGARLVACLNRLGELWHQQLGDPARSVAAYAKALTIDPTDETALGGLFRLLQVEGVRGDAVRGLERAYASAGAWAQELELLEYQLALAPNVDAQVYKLRQAARAKEERAHDLAAALALSCRAFALAPSDGGLQEDIVRLAAATQSWGLAADALNEGARALAAAYPSRSAQLLLLEGHISEESLGDADRAFEAYAKSLGYEPSSIDAATALVRTATTLRRWAEADTALSSAIAAGAGLRLLPHLVEVRRQTPGLPLYEALLAYDDVISSEPERLIEASRVALETLAEPALAQRALVRLYETLVRRLRGGDASEASASSEDALVWTVAQLVAVYERTSQVDAAARLLLDAATLPLSVERTTAYRRHAARLVVDVLGDVDRGVDILRALLREAPGDTESRDVLAGLYARTERLADLLALRLQELGQTETVDGRLSARLEVVSIMARIEERAGRLQALRANLDERPGHPASIEALSQGLKSQSRYAELADVLSEQAERLVVLQARQDAARLWAEVAELAEKHLSDAERAIYAYRQVVELAPSVDAFEALSRLYAERNEHGAAARWLERLFAGTPAGQRHVVGLRLARAQLAAGRADRAIGTLERTWAEDQSSLEVRDLLASLYRADAAWEPLANLLAASLELARDVPMRHAMVLEAAELFGQRLGDPARAIDVLEKGLAAAPDDLGLRTMYADGLVAAGRIDEAREVLTAIVESFGRRRSPERAAMHFKLGMVAQAQRDLETAIAEVERASKMDVGNGEILRALGTLSREAGDLERAERAYRTLLLIVRRAQPGDAVAVPASEVLYELHRIANARGDGAQAMELLESALEAAVQSAPDARRLKTLLTSPEERDLLLSALSRRLTHVSDPNERAEALSDLADVLERSEDRLDEAMRHRLLALEETPDASSMHDAALGLAQRTGTVDAYVRSLQARVESSQRNEDAPLVADLLLRLGRVYETDLGNLDAAAAAYRKAQTTGARAVDVGLALARNAGLRGDDAEQLRVLTELSHADDVPPDALYRLAEIQLCNEAQRAAGVETLQRALALDPQPARAAELLRRATETALDDAALMALYENVVRGAADDRMLLDFLERKAMRSDAAVQDVREAVEFASGVGESDRAVALLERLVEVARGTDARAELKWGLLALTDRLEQRGDVQAAMKWLREAIELFGGDEAPDFEFRLASLAAGPGGDLRLAGDLYERLLQADPTNRLVWEPLLRVLRLLNDESRLNWLVQQLLDVLMDPESRNSVRMEWARYLLAVPAREFDAVDILKAVLNEEPEHVEGTKLLRELYEKSGYDEDLVELLGRQLDAARDRNDSDQVADLSLKLGELYRKVQREEALHVYYRALDWVPNDRRILEALLDVLGETDDPAERTRLRERLLALESGEEAGRLARALFTDWQAQGNEEGMQRVLELGYRAAPDDDGLRSELERWYREREDWAPLAAFLRTEAARQQDADLARLRLEEAATLLRDALGDPASAAEVLRQARALGPDSSELLREHATTLAAAGQHEAAVAEVSASLEAHAARGEQRSALLRLRALLRRGAGQTATAVEDLEAAYAMSGAMVVAELLDVLDQHRQNTAAAGNAEQERAATLRLVELLEQIGNSARARDMLATWVERAPRDRASIERLRDLDIEAEDWPSVIALCSRLLLLSEAEEQCEVAIQLADACERAGRPHDARPALEQVHARFPSDERVGARLAALYEQTGAHRELASLLVKSAEASSDEAKAFEALRRAGRLLLGPAADPQAATIPLEAALRMRPDDHEANVLLSDAYIGAERLAEAGELLERVIGAQTRRRSPELAVLQHRMARLAGVVGDEGLRLQWLVAALDCDKNKARLRRNSRSSP